MVHLSRGSAGILGLWLEHLMALGDPRWHSGAGNRGGWGDGWEGRRWAGVANWIVMAVLVQFVECDCIDINSNVFSSYLFD